MLFKMLGMERAWENVSNTVDGGISRPRQVFVTQSRVLAEKVEEYYKKLAESHIAATRTEQESNELGAKKEKPADRALVDQDEEELWRGSLPKKYSELGDEHFPMFVTFDHVRAIILVFQISFHPFRSFVDFSKKISVPTTSLSLRCHLQTLMKTLRTLLQLLATTCFNVESRLSPMAPFFKRTGLTYPNI